MNSHLEQLGLEGLTGNFVASTDGDIIELEKHIGFTLPESYKSFLKHFGASLFVENVGFRALEPSPWSVAGIESFDVFYGISDKPASDILSVNRRLRNSIPNQTVAIGHDPGSNLVLLSARGDVLFFDRDSGRTFRSAADFDSFIHSFVSRRPIS